ncbi:hypothetical protein P12x_000229 [Tundrisphaera lichenicola]|uniref:hypothetical protein n=1 Tax=Tundrisphaera lichenicola TaxID=2029860 RepID=UPI003EB71A16
MMPRIPGRLPFLLHRVVVMTDTTELVLLGSVALGLIVFRLHRYLQARALRKANPIHPPEGYFVLDPASPTREERNQQLLGWNATSLQAR